MQAAEPRNTFDLGKVPLFAGLEPELLERIVRTASCRSAAKGERIYWEGDTPRAFYYLLSGHVRRALASPVGEEKVIDVLSQGQSFGLTELFGSTPYASFAEAVAPTVYLQVDKEGLLAALAESSPLTMRVLAAVAERQMSFERDVAACFFQSAGGRLVDYLLREAGPRLQHFGDTVFDLPMSKSLIAARIGASAETLSRALRDLSDAGLIEVRGKTIVLREELVARYHGHGERRAVPRHEERRHEERRHGERRTATLIGGRALAQQAAARAWM